MPKRHRAAEGGPDHQALDRAEGRPAIFEIDEDHAAFEQVLAQAVARREMETWDVTWKRGRSSFVIG